MHFKKSSPSDRPNPQALQPDSPSPVCGEKVLAPRASQQQQQNPNHSVRDQIPSESRALACGVGEIQAESNKKPKQNRTALSLLARC